MQPDRLGPSKIQLSIVDSLGNEYFSRNYLVSVIQNPTEVHSGELLIEPKSEGLQIFIRNPIFQPVTIFINGIAVQTPPQFNNSYTIEGPFTEEEVQEFISQGGITNLGLAEAYYSTETPLEAQPFTQVYPLGH